MLHKLRHVLRSSVANNSKSTIFQLTLMSRPAVFINNAKLASFVLENVPTKGQSYKIFRNESNIPDMFSSDGEEYTERKLVFDRAFRMLPLAEEDPQVLLSDFCDVLNKHVTSGEILDMKHLLKSLALDIICLFYFGYELNAVKGSQEGISLIVSLHLIATSRRKTLQLPINIAIFLLKSWQLIF